MNIKNIFVEFIRNKFLLLIIPLVFVFAININLAEAEVGKVELTINSVNVNSELVDFPVYVDLTVMPSTFWESVNSDGGDIRVYTADSIEVPYELVGFDKESRAGALFFKAPFLGHASNTLFRVEFGDPTLTSYPREHHYGSEAVWSDYERVYHLEETTGLFIDSTDNRDHASVEGNSPTATTTGAVLGQAQYFDGAGDYATFSNPTTGTDARTWQFWGQMNEGQITRFMSVESGGVGNWWVLKASDEVRSDGVYIPRIEAAGGPAMYTTDLNSGSPMLTHWVFPDGGTTISDSKMYVNGVEEVQTYGDSQTVNTSSGPAYIGASPSRGDGLRGVMDEVRIRSDELAPEWIRAEYINMSDPTSFYTITEVEDEPTDVPGWLERLRELMEEQELKDSIEKRLLKMIADAEEAYAEGNASKLLGKLNGFLGQLTGMVKSGRTGETVLQEAREISLEIETLLVAEAEGDEHKVPLITQIESPYPSEEETAAWASMTYASGTAASACGTTIAECGCALASMSMIAQSYGVKKGIDGSDVDPGNMNEWLTENDGYTSYGAALWGKVLEYLSRKQGGETVSHFALASYNETDTDAIDSFLEESGPAMAYNAGLGHFFVLTAKTAAEYLVRDPWWYNTTTSDDEKDAEDFVQDHNNTISKANLFEHQKQPSRLSHMIEIRLGSPAELRLTDSDGSAVGYDPETGTVVTEIGGGSYDQTDGIFTTGAVADPHLGKTLMLLQPEDNVYTLEVIGTGEGDYSLTVLTIGDSGQSEVTTVSGSTAPDEVDSFVLDLGAETDIEELIAEIETLIGDWEASKRDFILNKLRVITDKAAKENIIAVDATVAGLLRFVDGIDEAEKEAVVELLEELAS